jgi:hypothetical protein
MARRRLHLLTLAALALVCISVFAGCGKVSNKPGEEVREGLSTPLQGLRYTVFLTRLLNLKDVEDRGYLPNTKEAPPGHGLYGIFLQACNESTSRAATAANGFYVEDAQGNRFDPVALPKTNPFAYQGGRVPAQNCEPRRGSLAQLAPVTGAMLLFELPSAATENRPLKLHIENPNGPSPGNPGEAVVVLDM